MQSLRRTVTRQQIAGIACAVIVAAFAPGRVFADQRAVENSKSCLSNGEQSAQAPQAADESSPAWNPPGILLVAGIDEHDRLVLVHYRSIYIGFDGYSYNNRSESRQSLEGARIVTVGGKELTIAEARQRLGQRESSILVTPYHTQVADTYRPLFRDDALCIQFPKRAPVWKEIQDPGRPVR